MNRATRRRLVKAATCIDRSSKIPGRILTSLNGLNPTLLSGLAGRHGKRITAGGSVRRCNESMDHETGDAEALAVAIS